MKIKKRTTSLTSPKDSLAKARTVLPPVALRFKKQSLQQQTEEALQNVPRITNETIAEHRENVLKGARKYKYPLEHSKRRIITVSLSLMTAALVAFFVFTVLGLYKFQSTSTLMYRITQIVPFPVAKAGKSFVSYESYLFELRRYMHYYETQQQVDFESESGKLQLASQKPKAMEQVVQAAYVKELASKNKVSVSDAEVRDALDMLRVRSQLSQGDKELESIVKRFYGWSLDDLRREVRQNLLAQKVAAKLDTESVAKSENVLAQLRAGGDFAALAAQNSDDLNTKASGGQYRDAAITMSSQEVPAVVVRQLAKMQPNEVSGVLTTASSFEIIKLLGVENGKFKAAHIEIRYKDVSAFVSPLEKKNPARRFISIPPAPSPTVPTQN